MKRTIYEYREVCDQIKTLVKRMREEIEPRERVEIINEIDHLTKEKNRLFNEIENDVVGLHDNLRFTNIYN